MTSHKVKAAQAKIRKELGSRGHNGYRGLRRAFKHIDADGSGQLNFEEFFKGLLFSGIDIEEGEAQVLFHHFDGMWGEDAFLCHR